GPAGGTTTERGGPGHSRAARTPTAAPQPETAPTPAPMAPAFKSWLASFPGCDSPDRACHCDDRVLAVPHRQLDRGPAPKPTPGRLMVACIDLLRPEATDFAPVVVAPPGIRLGGPGAKGGTVRFELVGPGGRTTRRYGTWSCAEGDGRGRCSGPS